MGIQLIICVETSNKDKSDRIYIKETIEHFYNTDRGNVKLSFICMGGKGNYSSKSVRRNIENSIKEYAAGSKNGISAVIYCFDCDNWDRNAVDDQFLIEAKKYCQNQGARFVWFCRDIENVFLGEQIPPDEKTKRAEEFKRKQKVLSIKPTNLMYESNNRYQIGRSNLMAILDVFLDRR